MAWTTPKTWVAATQISEGDLNAYIRDLLQETMPAKAATAGDVFFAAGPNRITARTPSVATVATSQGTTSTVYTDLATVGPTVTVTTGTLALILFSASVNNNGGSAKATVVSTPTWVDAVVQNWALIGGTQRAANAPFRGLTHKLFTDLVSGPNTFTAKYATGAGTATFADRTLVVFPL